MSDFISLGLKLGYLSQKKDILIIDIGALANCSKDSQEAEEFYTDIVKTMYKWSNSDYFSEMRSRLHDYYEDMDEPCTKFFYELENSFENFIFQKKQNLDQDFNVFTQMFTQNNFINVISIKLDNNNYDILKFVCSILYEKEVEEWNKEQADSDFSDLVHKFENKVDRGIL